MTPRALVLVALAAIACEKSDRAIDPVWGKQACANCGMIVGDRRTAAEVLTKEGDRLFFDDPGCMVVWLSSHQDRHAWVKDAERGDWLDARAAHWKSGAKTPMDYGWEANASDGPTWDAMRAAVLERERSTR
jgi:copper chaperone NosL